MSARFLMSKDGRHVFAAEHVRAPEHFRPVVVIDPEDREQVERLSDLRAEIDRRDVHTQHWQDMQDALREFATPTEPKPEEPTGLGAVVEDADGRRWVRRAPAESWRESTWCPGDTHGFYDYADIAAVRVLSDGVQP